MTLLRHLRVVSVIAAMATAGLAASCSSSSARSGGGDAQAAAGTAATTGGDAKLAAKLNDVLRRGQTGDAHYTARVLDLETGRELYAVDPDAPFMPASNGKLAVSAATLDFLG